MTAKKKKLEEHKILFGTEIGPIFFAKMKIAYSIPEFLRKKLTRILTQMSSQRRTSGTREANPRRGPDKL